VKEKLPDRIKPVEVPDIEFPPIVAVNPGDGTYKNPTIDGPSGPTGFDEFPIDRDAQPIFRQEPNFQNITKAEAITLAFDVRPNGSVDKDSIVVLEATSSRLERPAIRAVRRWKYQGKVINGEALWQRDVRVRFTVQPPE
ncbi:MAG: TonB family protein, partial [Pseudomonadota bacterium]